MSPSYPGAQLMGLFWSLRLDGPLPAAVEPGLSATFLRAGLEQSAELAVAMGFDDVEPVVQRFERGCHCYIARVDGRLAGYGWINFDTELIGELGFNVLLMAYAAQTWVCAAPLSTS